MSRPFPRLNKAERQWRIVTELAASPSLRVNKLSERLWVSTETVRRDLAELAEAGLINRTYGGAVRSIPVEPAVAVREGLMTAERERIADMAAQLVEPNDILMIGGGATTLHVARRLAAVVNGLTVITHAFSIAVAIATNPTHKVLMLPGQYDGREGVVYGPETIDALQRFHADKAFLGASGLVVEGPNDAGIGPGLAYGMMMRRSTKTIIVADHTKFDRPSLTIYGAWSPDTTLVTDTLPKGKLASALVQAGATVIEAPCTDVRFMDEENS
jgi:DeoR/GlpR family transcriptional regulator of sugar metabolism